MNQAKYKPEEYLNFAMPSDDMETHITGCTSKLVKTRKDTVCCYCGSPIKAGDYALAEKGFIEKYEGNEPYRIHFCIECVDEELDVFHGKRDRETCFKEWKKRAAKSGWVH